MQDQPPLLTVSQVAHLLRLSPGYVRAMVRDGDLEGAKVSERRVLIPRAEVERLLRDAMPDRDGGASPTPEADVPSREDLRAMTAALVTVADRLEGAMERIEEAAGRLERRR